MARKTKVLTKTLYVYTEPKAYAYARSQAKKLQTAGGVSGWVTDLIIAKMAKKGRKSPKKEKRSASHQE